VKKIILIFTSVFLFSLVLGFFTYQFIKPAQKKPIFEIRSIDTVKYSRDVAGQMLDNDEFDTQIQIQVSGIASTGASHIAISTPYDERFVPFLQRWVKQARAYGLKVWFRGNFSGWERWFEYEKIDRETHKKLMEEFILKNPDLFEDGDIFTSCPECENGGEGDPRQTGDVSGFRKFLIDEYNISSESFGKINKKVYTGFYSMNYDVATLIMDRETTTKLGNVVVIDHYVKSPQKLASDVEIIARQSGGKVVLGEFGAPIPDIHGQMTEKEQAQWIETSLSLLSKSPNLLGINYWVSVGGSTQLWSPKGEKREAVEVITKYFNSYKNTKQ